MKKEFIDPFIKILPTLDLHGETKEISEWLLKEFINMNLKLKKYKLVVIHGKGTGTLKKSVHDYLSKDKRIEKYYIYGFNDGITIVELKEGDEIKWT